MVLGHKALYTLRSVPFNFKVFAKIHKKNEMGFFFRYYFKKKFNQPSAYNFINSTLFSFSGN